ncbi:MAG: CBS domain-containing protein [Verrucomicrobiae bacterium]|nr:CBS domain-containing protein [Verrucomicrobiae bacterium]NNJ42561.1 CBS domain-containing protein [Akkermansiaceae bacterium]
MEMTLAEIIQEKGTRICQIGPESSIDDAALLMKDERVGALLVMLDDEITGILTERDIVYRVLAERLDPAVVKVHEVMTKDVIVIKPALTIREAMHVVTEKRFRHMPVVSGNQLIGVVSSGDLTRRIAAEDEGVIHTLYDYIYGTYPG